MKWLRKKIRGIGRGIKKAFRGIGGAFKKVFGVFGKLGPIGSLALMFIMPGIGNAFAKGLGMLQGGIGTASVGTASTIGGTATAATAAGATEVATVARGVDLAAKATASLGGAATNQAAATLGATAGSGLLGSTNAALRAVGRIGQAIVGDANTLTRTLAGEFSFKSGVVGNLGTATNNVTGWLKDKLTKPGSFGGNFEDWLNQKRGDWGFQTNKGWQTTQEGLIDTGMAAEKTYMDALKKGTGGFPNQGAIDAFEKDYFATEAGKTIQSQMAAGTKAQGLLNRSIVKQGSYPSISETEKAFSEGWKVDKGKVVMKEGVPVEIEVDPNAWNPKKVAGTAAITSGIQLGLGAALADPAPMSGIVAPMPASEQAKDYYVQNMMPSFQNAGYQGPADYKSMFNSPFIYGEGSPDWLAFYGQGLKVPTTPLNINQMSTAVS